MYKEKYAAPEMELVEFETEDVITTSAAWDDDDDNNDTPILPIG